MYDPLIEICNRINTFKRNGLYKYKTRKKQTLATAPIARNTQKYCKASTQNNKKPELSVNSKPCIICGSRDVEKTTIIT